ncbi:hypothetical protein PT2222_30336 [Paraburkholderia tropica]
MQTPAPRESVPLLRERGLDETGDGRHVGAAGQLRLEHAHDLAHVLRARRAHLGDRGLHFGGDFGVRKLLGHVGSQNDQLGLLLFDEVRARGGFELADRVLALLDHLVDDRRNARVVERHALVDFTLLDGGEQQTNRGETLAFARAHRGLHVVVDPVFETHHSPELRWLQKPGKPGQ